MRIVYEVRGRVGLALMDGKFGGVDVVPACLSFVQRKCPAPHQASLLRFTSRHRHVIKRHITNQRRSSVSNFEHKLLFSYSSDQISWHQSINLDNTNIQTDSRCAIDTHTHTQVETSQYHLRRTLPRCVHIHVHSLKSTLYDFLPPPKISLAPSKKIPEARLRIKINSRKSKQKTLISI